MKFTHNHPRPRSPRGIGGRIGSMIAVLLDTIARDEERFPFHEIIQHRNAIADAPKNSFMQKRTVFMISNSTCFECIGFFIFKKEPRGL